MRSHLQGVGLKLQTVKSHQAMAEAMKSTAVAMKKMNKAVNVTTITKMLAEFERENQRTEMMQEGKEVPGRLGLSTRVYYVVFLLCQIMPCSHLILYCSHGRRH
jgi:hypothetical protein